MYGVSAAREAPLTGRLLVAAKRRAGEKNRLSPPDRPSQKQSTWDTELPDFMPRNPPFFVIFVAVIAAMILVGALLLWTPFASASGRFSSFTDALFTSASSVSCTGLIVQDTGTYWSFFGQAVILVLIQFGGLGFMLVSAYFLMVLGHRVSLLDFRFSDALDASSRWGSIKFACQTLAITVVFEGLGVFLLRYRFQSMFPPEEALWNSVFHSVSAFNNAGFSVLPGDIAIGLHSDSFVLLTLCVLIILGGLSAPVLINMLGSLFWRRLNLNSKIALTATFVLLVMGTVGIFLMEYGNPASLGPMSLPNKLLNAFFYSVTSRTAGFGALDLGVFRFSSLALIILLMFVGGVAGSTAGGIKVNTLAVLVLTVRSYLMGQSRVHAFGRQIPETRVHEAIAVLVLSILFLCVPLLLLVLIEKSTFLQILFESVSALGTVGLSMGITSFLSVTGRLILAFCMFIGRLGPLTVVMTISERRRATDVSEPEEAVKVS